MPAVVDLRAQQQRQLPDGVLDVRVALKYNPVGSNLAPVWSESVALDAAGTSGAPRARAPARGPREPRGARASPSRGFSESENLPRCTRRTTADNRRRRAARARRAPGRARDGRAAPDDGPLAARVGALPSWELLSFAYVAEEDGPARVRGSS